MDYDTGNNAGVRLKYSVIRSVLKMIDKERLLGIPNLKLTGVIEQMDDEQMQYYEQILISFVECFPENEQNIKTALEAKNAKLIETSLEAVCETLEKIYATEIAAKCRKYLGMMTVFPYERIEAFVVDFLKTVAMLSIDIQMAKYLGQDKYAEGKDGKPSKNKPNSEKIILAVDDATISLTMLKKSLQGIPYKLFCVNSGDEAIRFLSKNPEPDLFILDIEMPKMNGYELAEKIREKGQKAPIVFLTGNATKKNVVKAIEAGASDFIVKPIDKTYLIYKINKYM